VFDGAQQRPYDERDTPRPLSAYGRAKLHAEQQLAEHPHVLTVRTSAFFGPWDAHNFLSIGLERLQRGESWHAVDDQVVSPTYVPDLVHTSLDLLIDREHGLWHVANQGEASWFDFACRAADAAGLSCEQVLRIDTASAGQRAVRPPYSVLTSRRGVLTPTLDAALQRYLAEVTDGRREAPPEWAWA
jgi:dTDP-4-dehydrorhamnose reductase